MSTLTIPVSNATLTHLLAAAELSGRSLEDHVRDILVAAARRPDEDFPDA